MKILPIVILLIFITGCQSVEKANVKPFAEITVGYTFEQQIYQEKYQNCNYAFQLKAGFENKYGFSVGYAHDSNVDCGPPFDTRKEPFRDYLFITKKFGGHK